MKNKHLHAILVLLLMLPFLAVSQKFVSATTGVGFSSWNSSHMDKFGNTFISSSTSSWSSIYGDTIFSNPNTGRAYFLAFLRADGAKGYIKKTNYPVDVLASDNSQNLFIGYNQISSSIVINNDTLKADSANFCPFFGKYDSNFKLLWKKQMYPATASFGIKKMFCDHENNIYVYVQCTGGVGAQRVDTAWITGAYTLYKFDSNGVMKFHRETQYAQNFIDFAIDTKNNLIEFGEVNANAYSSVKTTKFGNNVSFTYPTYPNGKPAQYIAKYSPNNVAQWATLLNSQYDATILVPPVVVGLTSDRSDNPYLFGSYKETMRVNNQKFSETSLGNAPFIAKFSTSGAFTSLNTFMRDSLMDSDIRIRNMVFDHQNKMYLMMSYPRMGFRFFNIKTYNLAGSTSSDRFIACVNDKLECEWWRYLAGGESNNMLPKLAVTDNNELLLASSGSLQYGEQIFNVAVDRGMFTEDPASKGKTAGQPYLLKLNVGGTVSAKNMMDFEGDNQISLVSKPDFLSISTGKDKMFTVQIFGLNGNIVYQSSGNKSSLSINTSTFARGLYVAKISIDNKVICRKYIKQ